MSRCVLPSCLALLVITGSALADSATTNRLSEVVVTGLRLPATVETAPTAVSVILRDQLADQQINTVADALRDQPGIAVARTGQPGGPASVFLRGANSDNTLVLVDGIRVNNGFNNMFDFANLPVENIERIEVLRGPQSTLYGSEALGGVINIVTRKQVDRLTGAATFEGGSYDSLRTRLALAVPVKTDRFGTVTLVGDGGWFTTDNARSNSFYNTANGSGRIAWTLSDQFSATLLGTYFTAKAGAPNDRFNNDLNDWSRNENSLIGLTLDGRPLDWWTMKLVLAHNRDRLFYHAPDNPPGSNTFGDYSDLTTVARNQVDFQNVFTITEQHRLLVGGAYDDTRADDQSLFTFFGATATNILSHPIRDRALYGQYEFTPCSRVTFTVGGRLDDYNTVGSHATYRTGLRWTTPGTETIVRANVGSGFRAPSVRDLFNPPAFGGNPNLQPQESLGWDLGLEQPLLDNQLHVGATYFQNEFNNLFGRVPTTNIVVNIARARTLGVESFVTWTPLTNLTVRLAYTCLADAENVTTGAPLQRRPEHSGSCSTTWRFLSRFTANSTVSVVGARPDAYFNPATYAMTPVNNPAYVKADFGLSYDVCQNFTVFGRIENLLDQHYEEVFGYPALGRTCWGGGTVKF